MRTKGQSYVTIECKEQVPVCTLSTITKQDINKGKCNLKVCLNKK